MALLPRKLIRLVAPLARPILARVRIITGGVTLGVRCAAITPNDEICLVRHTYLDGWCLPGGGVSPGETIYQAACRELAEETGIVVNGAAEFVGLFANFKDSRRDHVALLVYRDWEFGEKVVPNLEIAEMAMFPIDDLPEDTTESTRCRIAEIRGQKPSGGCW